jgi:hypothetical protein
VRGWGNVQWHSVTKFRENLYIGSKLENGGMHTQLGDPLSLLLSPQDMKVGLLRELHYVVV